MPYTGIKYLPYVCSAKEVPKDIYQGQIHFSTKDEIPMLCVNWCICLMNISNCLGSNHYKLILWPVRNRLSIAYFLRILMRMGAFFSIWIACEVSMNGVQELWQGFHYDRPIEQICPPAHNHRQPNGYICCSVLSTSFCFSANTIINMRLLTHDCPLT